ncbi:MAG: hypothetical protein IJ782_01245 [Prevotella sp.]|nr:hypothetical protein [Prevotella sp.]
MGILKKKGMVKNGSSKTAKIFESLFGDIDFEHVEYNSPKDYIKQYWEKYQERDLANNTLNGNIFEIIIYTLLYREGLVPFYTQAKVAFVPNVEFDTILYTPSRPISLSLKTSLRERYKQADLEAIALVHVHRRAKSYLLTLDPTEAASCKSKVKSGEIIGLDGIVDCNTSDIDDLILNLKKIQEELQVSPKVEVIKGNLIK